MTYEIIATGSTGNAVLINNNILVDCGVPFKLIEPYADRIQLVLLSHMHQDHFKASTIRTLHQLHPAIRWATSETVMKELLGIGISPMVCDLLYPLEGQSSLTYFGLSRDGRSTTISAFPLVHNVPNIGFRIKIGEERIFYATDTGSLDGIEAKNYDLYLIEANHTKAEIYDRIIQKQRAGEYSYEGAAVENHLSLEQATDWLLENVGEKSRYQFLHQHKEVNNGRAENVCEENH